MKYKPQISAVGCIWMKLSSVPSDMRLNFSHVDSRTVGRSFRGHTKTMKNSSLFGVSPAGMNHAYMDCSSVVPD
jgi:hypothetical protein